MAEDRDALVHPAFRARRSQITAARQMQISQETAAAIRTLASIENALRRIAATADAFPEVAQIALAVAPALRNVSASLRRWHDGGVPGSAETAVVAECMRTICAGFDTAMELCAGGNALPVASGCVPKTVAQVP